MLRTALRPRWLGALAGILALAALFTWLGFWQLGVAKSSAREEMVQRAENSPTVPVDTLIAPHGAFPGLDSSRRVSAVGRYDADRQFLVVDRRLAGVAGSWVVTPLVVETTGARLAVLRGFTTANQAPPPSQLGTVTVVGSLAPGESPSAAAGLPEGQMGSIDLSILANRWDGDLYNAFVFAISETPDATGAGAAPGQIQRVPPPSPDPGMSPRNTAYAIQWWVFAAFVLWMWWKMVADEHRRETGVPAPAQAGADPSGGEADVRIDAAAVRKALGLYKVLAVVAGIALFVLILEMVLKYGMHQNNFLTQNWSYIHGFIYMAYAASIANLGFKAQWPMMRIIANLLTGFVPFLPFIAERRVSADVERQLAGV